MTRKRSEDWRTIIIDEFGWQDQDSVKRWVEKLKSEVYAQQCFYMLQILVEETKKTPDQLINERIQQIRDTDPRIRATAEDVVLRIHRKYAEEKPGMAINFFRKMKSFYKHNYCPLGCSDPEYSPSNHVEDRKNVEKLTKEKIRELCEKAQLQVRFGLLVLAQSGGRIGAVTSLTYGDVKDDLETEITPSCIWLKQQTRKKGGTYPSFICGDAVKLLRLILKSKREVTDNTPIFNIQRQAIQDFLRNNGLHAHLFRKRVQTTLEGSGIPLNWVDRLLGHVPRGAQGKTYSLPPINKLREHYIKAVPELKIYGSAEVVFNGDFKEYMVKCFAKLLSKYVQPVSEEEIKEALEELKTAP